jgi:general stress protein CsbA
MSSNQESINTLNEIREMMERSSKFLSLSGLSGVFAGAFALIGAAFAYVRFKTDLYTDSFTPITGYESYSQHGVSSFLITDGCLVLFLSLASGIIFTVRKGRKRGLQVWNGTSRRLLISMLIPLVTGGIFSLAMFTYGYIWLVFPVTLIFYGLALVNASRFTYPEVFYLGISEIAIGCVALFLTGYSLLFWSVGFGVLHIIYGLTMYNKYDRKKQSSDQNRVSNGLGMVLLLMLVSSQSQGQYVSDSTTRKTQRWYDKETIYLQGGNGFVKNNMLYKGQKALKNEFSISEGGLQLYLKSRRTRNIGLLISVAGSAGSIVSLISGNRDNLRKFFWVSLGTGVIASAVTMQANNQRDQAVWLRNRDALLLLEANN